VAELILGVPSLKYMTGKDMDQKQSLEELHLEFHPSYKRYFNRYLEALLQLSSVCKT
jgi:hypothetical protein